MCGIAGFLAEAPDDGRGARRVRAMVERMRYRGPDHADFYDAGRTVLGMCRLSIVDVASGFQPLYNETGDIALVCNGEIYNHASLRRQLQARGHALATGSDCETIVHLYEEYGDACLDHLRGMFAFLLWDGRRGRLLAARDRIGIKPLYWATQDGETLFCSEFAPLARALGGKPDLDPAAIWDFLNFGFAARDQLTMDRRIQRLAPGELLVFEAGTGRSTRYFTPRYLTGARDGESLSVDTLREVFLTGLDEHLVCEVPSAIMLSGGLDSSSLAAYAVRLGYTPLTITAGYEGAHDCDEREAARQTAGRLGLPVEEVVFGQGDYLKSFEALMRHCDEPVADIASVPQWEIFARIHDMGIKVLHSGLGGDELFFGYGLWNQLVEKNAREGAYHGYFRTDDVSGYYHHPNYRGAREFLEQTMDPDLLRSCAGRDRALAAGLGLDGLDGPDRVYHLLFRTWLPNNCLHLADRLSMAHSLELRVPLLDDRLVDYVHGLPGHERFRAGQSKPIFKQMLAEVFEPAFLDRPKQGFTPPFRIFAELLAPNDATIFEGYLSRHCFDPAKLAARRGDGPPEMLYRLLTFEKWLENSYA